jgi:tripartite-type tricarboxylate transporter receptor subunit TctC
MPRAFAVAATALLMFCGVAHANQPWPNKPIRMISPFPPGGGIDAAARIISQALSEQLGQQLIVENRSGAGGRIGTEMAAKATPDGYTLLLGSIGPNAIIPSSTPKLSYDAIKDFAPISLVASTEYTLVVHPNLPARSVKELVALAKARPGEITFASSGNLVASHLSGELLNLLGNIKTTHVPYSGTGPAAVSVLSGETVMAFGSGPSVTQHVAAGKLRALATTGKKRSNPNLQTMSETLPGYEVTQWYGVLAPVGAPQAVLERLHESISQAIANPKVAQKFVQIGCDATGTTALEFASLIRSDIEKWGKVIKASRIAVD